MTATFIWAVRLPVGAVRLPGHTILVTTLRPPSSRVLGKRGGGLARHDLMVQLACLAIAIKQKLSTLFAGTACRGPTPGGAASPPPNPTKAPAVRRGAPALRRRARVDPRGSPARIPEGKRFDFWGVCFICIILFGGGGGEGSLRGGKRDERKGIESGAEQSRGESGIVYRTELGV